MKNVGFRMFVEVTREDKSRAQAVEFDQRGLSYEQLLELQEKVVDPAAAALQAITTGWRNTAKNAASDSPSSGKK
jgi:peptide methionine sulfoxide reductase MsrA